MGAMILPGPLLRERTTIRLGGRAQAEIVVRSEEDLAETPEAVRRLTGAAKVEAGLFVLGRGSNVLADDGPGGELPVVLLSPRLTGAPEVVEETAERLRVRTPAGVGLPRLLGWLRGRGASGLEELTGVPGQVGGAVAMNAGSHGVAMDDRLARVRIWTPAGGARWLARGQWTAGYRLFRPTDAGPDEEPGLFVVLAAELDLARAAPEKIGAAMRGWFERKKAVQPVTAASAGCCFKNPAGESAGRLLDLAGFRGRRLGGMAFSGMHANFLVNLGQGTSRQAFELIDLARREALRRFGLDLQLEVKTCPCP